MKKSLILLLFVILPFFAVLSQEKAPENYGKEYVGWHAKCPEKDKIMGTGINRAYNELLQGKKPKKTIIVAVIDGGTDVNHPDLKDNIWTNEKEIASNGVDDDKNGYTDDINGWNFVGNAKGENVENENLEYTRIVKDNLKDYKGYSKAKEMYDEKLKEYVEEKETLEGFLEVYNKAHQIILQHTNIEVENLKDLKKVKPINQGVKASKAFLTDKYKAGITKEVLKEIIDNNDKYLNYYLNKDHNPRTIVGDNPRDFNDRNYGNNDVKGPRAEHGTGVAGVIGAVRNNQKGIDGVAADVKIMVLRSTPGGDERDKDVALAIIYAVNNGANIINMSFGKQFSPEKAFVEEAVKYAESKNVLLIHSAGNSSNNIDKENSYPDGYYSDGTKATNWFTVGASGMKADKTLAAGFSNYGKKNVDIFAPGVDIVTLAPDNTYKKADGTSFSGPVVTGIAALVWSYYPELTPQELISLLMESAYKGKSSKKVTRPGSKAKEKDLVVFEELSKSGGIINAYNALMMAAQKYGR